jgi:hypothetical protein
MQLSGVFPQKIATTPDLKISQQLGNRRKPMHAAAMPIAAVLSTAACCASNIALFFRLI